MRKRLATIMIWLASPILSAAALLAGQAQISPALLDQATASAGPIDVVVVVRTAGSRGEEAQRVRAAMEKTAAVAADVEAGGGIITRRFGQLPMVAVRVGKDSFRALLDDPRVEALSPVLRARATRTEGKSLMNVPAVHLDGNTGSGVAIAVLDTGVAYGHDELAPLEGKTISLWDAVDQDSDAADEAGHGTSVAAIAAGSGNGVAPDATIVAVRVLNASGDGTSVEILEGLDKVLESVRAGNPHNIRVANLSLGGYDSTYWPPGAGDCDAVDPATSRACADLTEAGVLVVVSAGNGACSTGIAWPACVSSAMAVGAVYDASVGTLSFGGLQCVSGSCSNTAAADQIACYSDSGPALDVWAPSHCATTASRNGPSGTVGCFGGTSAAAPYAAGVAALLAQGTTATPEQLRQALRGTGSHIPDARNHQVRRRIDAVQALRFLRGECQSPDAPAGPRLDGVTPCGTDTLLRLAWDGVAEATAFRVQISEDPTFSSTVELLTTGTSIVYPLVVTERTTFHIRVSAVNSCSESAFSPVLSVTYTPSCVSGGPTSSVITGVAHTPGFGAATWTSELAVVNLQENAADINLTFTGEAGELTATARLAANQQAVWRDVLPQLFGVIGDDVGAIHVEADGPVAAVARTFARSSRQGPSYGQGYPALPKETALAPGELGFLPGLRGSQPFYSNLELLNLDASDATVEISLFGDDGAPIAPSQTVSVGAGRRVHLLRVIPEAVASAFAMLKITSSTGRIVSLASVVDENSKDPTTILMSIVDPGASEVSTRETGSAQIVSGIARTPGFGGAFWSTDLAILNPTPTTQTITLTYRGQGGSATTTLELPGRSQRVWYDVLRHLFSITSSDVGFLEITETVVAVARTYSTTSPQTPTFGQGYFGTPPGGTLGAGQLGYLPGLRSDAGFYTNLELINPGAEDVRVEVRLLGNAGASIVPPMEVNLTSGTRTALNKVLPFGVTGAFAVVRVLGSSGVAIATASVVDEVSKDPTTITMTVTGSAQPS